MFQTFQYVLQLGARTNPEQRNTSRFQMFINESDTLGFHSQTLGVLLEVGFMLLDLDHQVVQVDELGADGQATERRLVQDLVEAVVVLDQLGQSALQQEEGEEECCSTSMDMFLLSNIFIHTSQREKVFLLLNESNIKSKTR